MVSRNLVNQAVRYALLTGAVAMAGHASTAAAENADTPAQLGKVTVTGSRIKRTDVETAQPITRISRQQIQNSGYTQIGQLLQQISQSGAALNSQVNNGGNGGTYIDLRGFGAKRTLVLVDGRRWIRGLAGGTNLNTIPTSIIDHIEILQDGASAIYGSDAITGVINIITIKNYQGAEANAYLGIYHKNGRWDGKGQQYDFTMGAGNDRGDIVFNTTYVKENPISAASRNISKEPLVGTGVLFGSGEPPRGQFITIPTSGGGCPSNVTLTSNGTCDFTLKQSPAEPSLNNFRDYVPTQDNFNYAPLNDLLTPNKRVSIYVQGHYDLLDNVTFTANAEYVRQDSAQVLAPTVVGIGQFGFEQVGGQNLSIAADQKYNPFGVKLAGSSTDPCVATGNCDVLGLYGAQPVQAGPRVFNNNLDTFHVFAGFNGYINLFNREIDWDVGFAQNRTQRADLTTGLFNTQRLQRALGPAGQCSAPCVPFNAFGGPSLTPAMLNYVTFEEHDVSQTNLRDWTVNLSSNLYNLPAGPLSLAIGYERLDQYGYSHPDALVSAGNTTGNATQPTDGRIVTDAEYAELNIPLLADLPGVKELSVDIANRWSQFELAGGETGMASQTFNHASTGRLNIRYQVDNDLLLRATWSKGFRVPNISELFFGASDNFPTVQDPCAPTPKGNHAPGTPLPAGCAAPHIQTDAQIRSQAGGNPKLQPESSISRTVGFVYSPSFVPGLDINADYFKIELTQAVATIGTQNILNGCYIQQISQFCNNISLAGNSINNIRNLNTNIGSLLTEGADIGIHYKFPATPFGDFAARINGTFVRTFDRTVPNTSTTTGFATSHLAGHSTGTVYPKRRFNGYLDWDYGNFSAEYHIEFIDSSIEQCTVPSNLGLCTAPNNNFNFQGAPTFTNGRNHIGATTYHDISASYTYPGWNTTLTLGVKNLFDHDPPISVSTFANSYDPTHYRVPGRFFFGRLGVKF